MDDRYLKQAALVVRCIPAIAKEDCFAIVSLQGQPEDFGIPHLAELPAVIWKRKNLETLRQSNPSKFAEQRKLLDALLT